MPSNATVTAPRSWLQRKIGTPSHREKEEAIMPAEIDRREFLRSLGVGMGSVGAAAAAIPLIGAAQAQTPAP